VVFCVVVSPVLEASIPVVSKLVLRGPAAEPPKTHIHHLAPTRNNSVVNNPCSCRVVGLDGALGLGPSHINEGLAVWNHFKCSDEEGASSDSAADAITNLMIWAMERTAPMKRG
jgi:hypothetical protein